MEQKKDGGPAFPMYGKVGDITIAHQSGMTLRDYFAAKAMVYYMNEWADGIRNGKYVSEITGKCDDDSAHSIIAHDAYEMADAMLKAREQ